MYYLTVSMVRNLGRISDENQDSVNTKVLAETSALYKALGPP